MRTSPDAGTGPVINDGGIALLDGSFTDFPLRVSPEPSLASSIARRVELVSAGLEPRRVLRHRFGRGRQKLSVRSFTRVQQQQSVLAEIKVEAPLDVVLEPKTPPDRASFSYELGPVKLSTRGDDSIRPPTQGALAEGVKIAGRGILNGRGIVTEHRFEPPLDETDSGALFARSLISAMLELPEEPVGKGARWDVVLEADSSGVRLTQRNSYEILELRGASARVRIKQNESVAVDGGAALPDLAMAPTEGEWTVRLGQAFPTGRQAVEEPLLSGAAAALNVSTELSIELRAAK